ELRLRRGAVNQINFTGMRREAVDKAVGAGRADNEIFESVIVEVDARGFRQIAEVIEFSVAVNRHIGFGEQQARTALARGDGEEDIRGATIILIEDCATTGRANGAARFS